MVRKMPVWATACAGFTVTFAAAAVLARLPVSVDAATAVMTGIVALCCIRARLLGLLYVVGVAWAFLNGFVVNEYGELRVTEHDVQRVILLAVGGLAGVCLGHLAQLIGRTLRERRGPPRIAVATAPRWEASSRQFSAAQALDNNSAQVPAQPDSRALALVGADTPGMRVPSASESRQDGIRRR